MLRSSACTLQATVLAAPCRLGLPNIYSQQSAGDCPISQQPNTPLLAVLRHRHIRPAIDEGVLNWFDTMESMLFNDPEGRVKMVRPGDI